jgi:hypothetical protein
MNKSRVTKCQGFVHDHSSHIRENQVTRNGVTHLHEERNIYFWTRDAKSSNAEVDYLVTSGSTVYPVEVKPGKTGTLKSMHFFLKEHPSCPLGIRFSMQKLSFYDRILSIPLYMVKHWERMVKSVV